MASARQVGQNGAMMQSKPRIASMKAFNMQSNRQGTQGSGGYQQQPLVDRAPPSHSVRNIYRARSDDNMWERQGMHNGQAPAYNEGPSPLLDNRGGHAKFS